jgi:DNA-binding MurR/RpiR family transcriptional regulator
LLARLGFGRYPDFQERLRGEVTRSMSASPLSRALARRAAPSDDSVFLRAVQQRARLVTRLQDTVPPGEIKRAVALLAGRPKHVVISGGYFSRLVARMLAMQLDQLIPRVDYADEPLGADIGKYLRIGRDSVAVVFDLRRHELAANEVVSMAKARGASVILITDDSLSPSAEQADIVLPVAVDGIPFDSFAGLLVLTESLVDAVFHGAGEAALERMADWEPADPPGLRQYRISSRKATDTWESLRPRPNLSGSARRISLPSTATTRTTPLCSA